VSRDGFLFGSKIYALTLTLQMNEQNLLRLTVTLGSEREDFIEIKSRLVIQNTRGK